MRYASGFLLWLVATAIGASAAVWFSLAGLGWANGFITRHYWEEGESELGVTFGVFALVVWALMLAGVVITLGTGSLSGSRAARVLSITLVLVSILLVAAACISTFASPEPPSEYPSPPWNRA